MKYLGITMPESSYYLGGAWHTIPKRTLCPAVTPDEQMFCSKYEPATKEEINRTCSPAPEFSCRFSECGCSDLCSA